MRWLKVGRRGTQANLPAISVAAVVLGFGASAFANINLELRPVNPTVTVGSTVNLGLYAVSDSGSSQLMSAVQVIITWDIAYVQLSGLSNAGAAPWLTSGFGAEPYGLNTSLLDGNGMWIALAPLGAANAIPATPSGTLLTTFRFQALTPTTPTTLVNIVLSAGNPVGQTKVFDGTVPNTNVLGTVAGANVRIVLPCPADLNHNLVVNIDDLVLVITHWGNCPVLPQPCVGNVNGDQRVDIDDLVLVITNWGRCP